MSIDDITDEINSNKPSVSEGIAGKTTAPEAPEEPIGTSEPSKSAFTDPSGNEHPNFNPDLHRVDRKGFPVKRKNGTYALRTGRPRINKGAEAPKAESQPNTGSATGPEPELVDPAAPPPRNENKIFAEEMVTMEQYGAFLLWQNDGKFTSDGRDALIMAWERYATEKGTVKIPLWAEMMTAHAVAFGAIMARPKPQTFLNKVKFWIYNTLQRRKKTAPSSEENKSSKFNFFSKN